MKKDIHLKQAKHNLDFVEHCEQAFKESYYDWKITALFYCSLHLVRGYLEKNKVNTTSFKHKDIEATIDHDTKRRHEIKKRVPFEKNAFKSYSLLRDNSENARYDCMFLPDDKMIEHAKDVYQKSIQAYEILNSYLEKKGLYK